MIYGCKTYVKLTLKEEHFFEERLLMVNSDSFDNAIKTAETASVQYAKSIGGKHVDFVQCYMSKDFVEGASVTEVYSLLRKSNLAAEDFLDFYEDSGLEVTNFDRGCLPLSIDVEEFLALGLGALTPKQLLKLHFMRYNQISYYNIARIVFPADQLTGDTIVALGEGIKKALSCVKI